MFLNISYYIGARSAENFQNISSTFLKKLLTNGRAQRGKFLKLFKQLTTYNFTTYNFTTYNLQLTGPIF